MVPPLARKPPTARTCANGEGNTGVSLALLPRNEKKPGSFSGTRLGWGGRGFTWRSGSMRSLLLCGVGGDQSAATAENGLLLLYITKRFAGPP
jgi:hypothetical protein